MFLGFAHRIKWCSHSSRHSEVLYSKFFKSIWIVRFVWDFKETENGTKWIKSHFFSEILRIPYKHTLYNTLNWSKLLIGCVCHAVNSSIIMIGYIFLRLDLCHVYKTYYTMDNVMEHHPFTLLVNPKSVNSESIRAVHFHCCTDVISPHALDTLSLAHSFVLFLSLTLLCVHILPMQDLWLMP